MTRLLCILFRHPLLLVHIQERGVSLVGKRCRCARRVEAVGVYRGQYPQRRA